MICWLLFSPLSSPRCAAPLPHRLEKAQLDSESGSKSVFPESLKFHLCVWVQVQQGVVPNSNIFYYETTLLSQLVWAANVKKCSRHSIFLFVSSDVFSLFAWTKLSIKAHRVRHKNNLYSWNCSVSGVINWLCSFIYKHAIKSVTLELF